MQAVQVVGQMRIVYPRSPPRAGKADRTDGSRTSKAAGCDRVGSFSFDHLVGAAQEREREGDAEGFGCLEVDKQLHFRDLLDRQISRLVALEYASGIDACLTMRLHKTACVTHQTAGDSEVLRQRKPRACRGF